MNMLGGKQRYIWINSIIDIEMESFLELRILSNSRDSYLVDIIKYDWIMLRIESIIFYKIIYE